MKLDRKSILVFLATMVAVFSTACEDEELDLSALSPGACDDVVGEYVMISGSCGSMQFYNQATDNPSGVTFNADGTGISWDLVEEGSDSCESQTGISYGVVAGTLVFSELTKTCIDETGASATTCALDSNPSQDECDASDFSPEDMAFTCTSVGNILTVSAPNPEEGCTMNIVMEKL